jgi:hypothetical protein
MFEKATPAHMSKILESEEVEINVQMALPYEAKLSLFGYNYYYKDDPEDSWLSEEIWGTPQSLAEDREK